MSIKTDFFAQTRDVMGGDDLVAERYLNGKMTRSQWIRKRAFRRMKRLPFELGSGHLVTAYIKLGREWEFGDFRSVVLMTFYMCKGETTDDRVRCRQSRQYVSVIGKPSFGNQSLQLLDVADSTRTVHIEQKSTLNIQRVKG